jgi:hypothetical protein
LETKKQEVMLELGSAVFEAINQNCWEGNPHAVSISSLNQSIALLKVEIYMMRLGKSIETIASNWSQLQPALLTYLKAQNIVLSHEMSTRLTQIQKHFGEMSADKSIK